MAPLFSYYQRLMDGGGRQPNAYGHGGGGGGLQPLQTRYFAAAPDFKPRKNWTPIDAPPEGAVDPTTGLPIDPMFQGDAPLEPIRLSVPGDPRGGGGGRGMGGGGRGMGGGGRDRGPMQWKSDWSGFAGWRGGNNPLGVQAYAEGRPGAMNPHQFNRYSAELGLGDRGGGGRGGGGGMSMRGGRGGQMGGAGGPNSTLGARLAPRSGLGY